MRSRRRGAAACLAAAWLGLGSVARAAEPPAEESGPSFGSPEDRALWRELKTATSEAVLHLARISQCSFRIRYARPYQELEARAADAAVAAEAKALRARLEEAAAGAQSAVPPDGGRVHACRYALLDLEQAMEFPDDPGMRDDVPRRRDEARQCAARMGALVAAVRPRADALEAALADVDALVARTPRPATAPAAAATEPAAKEPSGAAR